MNKILEVSELTFEIGSQKILDRLNFSVIPGEKVGIIGPNGSGKTSLFNCLSGFVRINSGSVIFQGKDITNKAPDKRARMGLGRVFQNFGIFKEMSVLDNVLTAMESRRHPRRGMRDKAREYLALVNLEAKALNKAGSLSGGQLRLLEIVRTLAFEADLFLLDEPTAGVSPKMKSEVEALLLRLQELKKTVLIIEHDISFIGRLCDRIIVLDVGQLVLQDSPENIRDNPRLQEIYFGSIDSSNV